jgi:putative nucleotidyltransferase with HDIG domain
VHHAVRWALLGGLAVLTTALFPPDARLRLGQYSPGGIANADITAQVQFSVPVGPEELERARTQARLAAPPTLDFRREAADSTAARLEAFFQRLAATDSAAPAGTPVREAAIRRVLAQRSIAATSEQIALLEDADDRGEIRRAALRSARELLPTGVVAAGDLEGSVTNTVIFRDPGSASERSVDRDVILTASEYLDRASRYLGDDASPDAAELLRLVLLQHVEYSLTLNLTATQLDRDRMARAVPTTRQTILAGDPVVRANEEITPAVLERLAAYEEALRNQGLQESGARLRVTPILGAGLLNLLILSVFWVFIQFFRGEVYDRSRWIALVGILIAVYLLGAGIVVRSDWPVEALPVVFSALAVAVLWDGRMALVLATTLAVLSSVQSGLQGVGVLIPTFVGGAVAGMSVRVVRRRAQTWVFIALIFAAYALSIVGLTLVFGGGVERLGVSLAAAGGNAILSAILAMGFIPVFEMVTGITTDQTLLEWGDPNRPLLRRLSMEAPGTYAHTINVANLAEAAATAIGANGLLCRVGLYYHDVGKMLKPHYFVENQPDGRNPHDRLKPDMSAAIVREHITEGARLAREEKVPGIIADFITEHHGTQKIGFFWERAVEEYGEDSLNPDDYRYPGPRPRSRETAIAMLADSTESATRALQDPTPERIRDLVNNVVEGKIAQGQLDDAPLTFREVNRIKDQFVKVLSGVHHQRIDYPETRHLTEAAPAEGAPAEAAPGEDSMDGDGSDAGVEAAVETAGGEASAEAAQALEGEGVAPTADAPDPRKKPASTGRRDASSADDAHPELPLDDIPAPPGGRGDA